MLYLTADFLVKTNAKLTQNCQLREKRKSDIQSCLYTVHDNLGNSVFASLPEICFVLIMYCTLFHMLGHVTSSANDQLYTIEINKDFLMRLLKRGDIVMTLLITVRN